MSWPVALIWITFTVCLFVTFWLIIIMAMRQASKLRKGE